MKTVLITGANGFIGQMLSRRLLELGYNVRLVTQDANLAGSYVIDEDKDDLGLKEVIQNVDVIIHLAARVHIVNETEADPLAAFRKVNVGLTKKLAQLAIGANVKRFVFVSTLNIYVDGSCYDNVLLNEATPANPKTPYAISKYEAEQYLKTIPMETVIIRPPLVYGPNVKANFLSLLKLAKTGLPLPVGLLNSKRSMVSVNNLADFIICCIENPVAANEDFLISDDCDISTKELFTKLIKLFGKKPLLLPVPAKILLFLGKLLGKKTIVDRLCLPLQVDITKAKTLLKWRPAQTLDDGLKGSVEWYKSI